MQFMFEVMFVYFLRYSGQLIKTSEAILQFPRSSGSRKKHCKVQDHDEHDR